jgi:hypothetical protein
MEDQVIRHAQPLAWLNNGVLAEHVATYQAFLEERRYALKTRRGLPVLSCAPCTLDGQHRPLGEAD